MLRLRGRTDQEGYPPVGHDPVGKPGIHGGAYASFIWISLHIISESYVGLGKRNVMVRYSISLRLFTLQYIGT